MASWRRVAPALVGLVLSVATLPQPSQGGFAISRLSGRPGAEVAISGSLPDDDTDKVIVDEKAGSGVVPYLPLSEFTKKAPAQAPAEESQQ